MAISAYDRQVKTMSSTIRLNSILNFDDAELAKTKIRFNQWNGIQHPMDVYTADPEEVNTRWLFWRTKTRYYQVGQNAICFLRLNGNSWLLTTIKRVTKELGVYNDVNYEGYELEHLKPFYGRIIVKYQKSHQAQCVNAKSVIDLMEVQQILPAVFDGEDFPGYDKVRLSFSQLELIVNRNKRDWVAALENQKAVYLITDLNNGKLYVGSAYGENGMLLQRWRNYIATGHGGNIDLIQLVNEVGPDYLRKHFQYSILENYNARVDKDVILQRESWWKDTLATRKFGYNEN